MFRDWIGIENNGCVAEELDGYVGEFRIEDDGLRIKWRYMEEEVGWPIDCH